MADEFSAGLRADREAALVRRARRTPAPSRATAAGVYAKDAAHALLARRNTQHEHHVAAEHGADAPSLVQRAQEELAEFEAQAARDMNAFLPYQNLYQPTVTRKKKKRQPLDAAAEAAADAEAAAVAAAARSALGPAARGGAYAAAAGAIIALLGAAATGPGLSTVQLVIGTLAVSALGFQVWLAANGGLGGDNGDQRR